MLGLIHSIFRVKKKVAVTQEKKNQPTLAPRDFIPSTKKTLNVLAPHEQVERQTLRLLNALLPNWHTYTSVKMERLSGALTNCVYVCTSVSTIPSSSTERKVLVRVYGDGSEDLFSREAELDRTIKLASLGLVPRVFAVFGNGRFEEFIPSKTCTKDTIRKTHVAVGVAQKVRELHTVTRHFVTGQEEQSWWLNAMNWSGQIIQKHPNKRAERVRALMQLAAQYVAWLRENASDDMVFAHNDLQYGNILLLPYTEEVTLIDFEYGGFAARAFDLANHFCEYMYNYHDEKEPHILHADWYPTEESQKQFIRAYYDYTNDEEVVDALYQEVNKYIPASHLMWGLWGWLQAEKDDVAFDYVNYGIIRLNAFEHSIVQNQMFL